MYYIQHCFICRRSYDSEDAGIEPRTVVTLALAVARSNHSARSHPLAPGWFSSPVVSVHLTRGTIIEFPLPLNKDTVEQPHAHFPLVGTGSPDSLHCQRGMTTREVRKVYSIHYTDWDSWGWEKWVWQLIKTTSKSVGLYQYIPSTPSPLYPPPPLWLFPELEFLPPKLSSDCKGILTLFVDLCGWQKGQISLSFHPPPLFSYAAPPETHIKRQATWHDCLPSVLGNGDKWSEIVYGE
jgi:hypothetical protein